jgi:Putative zinc-finger
MTSQPSRECREVELSLGVLVLGALEPAERPAIEAHLAACPRCSAILAELAPLPGLMHRLDPFERDAAAEPRSQRSASQQSASQRSALQRSALQRSASQRSSPPQPLPLVPLELRERLVLAARKERTRRRRWVAGIAAAAVFVALSLAAAASGGLWSDRQATVASATDARTSVRAEVRLMPDATGSALALSLTGVTPAEHCKLVAIDAQGRRDVAAAWVATYDGRATVTGHTSFRPDQITRLVVVTDAGSTLVRVPIRG